MCSYSCPCPISYSGPWTENVSGLSENDLNSIYERTYDAAKDDSQANTGLNYLYFTNDSNVKTFTSFADCLARDDIDYEFEG